MSLTFRTELDPLFRTIFEQSPLSTQVFSPDGETVAANRAWEVLWGVRLDQILPYNVLADRQLIDRGIMPYIQRGFAGEHVHIPAIKYIPAETRPEVDAVPYRWVRAELYPVRDPEGAIRHLVLVHEDITDQKRAEEALQESEARFRAVFNAAPVGIALIDGSGRFLAVNPARAESLGYTPDEMVGRHYEEFSYPGDLERDREANAQAREAGLTEFQVQKRFVRKDGQARWNRVSVAAVPGAVGGFISITEDITEARERDEARMQLERQKNDFLAAAAHDLRTPLTSIRGFAQLAIRRMTSELPRHDRVLDDLHRIVGNAARMSGLIEELLDVTRAEMDPVTVQRQRVDLAALIRGVAEGQWASRRHPVEIRCTDECPEGYWDAARLERVISNLISNAVKYSPEGTPIHITIGQEGDWAVLHVRDYGVGIPADEVEHVFERFYRASNVPQLAAGTGLGLTSVRQIVQQHGGTVSIRPADPGTVVTVRLPVENGPERPSEPGVEVSDG